MPSFDREALKDLFLKEDATGEVVPRYEVLRTTEEIAEEIGMKLSGDRFERRCQFSDLGSALNWIGYWALDEGWNWVQFQRPRTAKDNGHIPVVYGFTRKLGPTKLHLLRLEGRKVSIQAQHRRALNVARENKLLESGRRKHR